MARTCPSCGGIIGRDCFNPMECAMITARDESRREFQQEILYVAHNELSRQFEALKRLLIDTGVVDGIQIDIIENPPPQPKIEYERHYEQDDLPF
jgi:hypothetical protein